MSQGTQWIDKVMIPLSSLDDTSPPRLSTSEYNCIYEAASRGTEAQGRALIQAITSVLDRAVLSVGEGVVGASRVEVCKCAPPDMPGMLGAVCARCHGYIVQK